MNVVPLHHEVDAFDLAKALRNIADEIERDAYTFTPTKAVLVLADESERLDAGGDIIASFNWQTHGLGKGVGVFAARGILASALNDWERL